MDTNLFCCNRFKRVLLLILLFVLSFRCISCSGTNAVIRYKDTTISENMYSYWLSTLKANFVYTYGGGNDSEELWNRKVGDTDLTYEEYAENEILRTIKYFAIASELFKEYGLKIDSATVNLIDSDIDEKEEYYGGRAQLNSALATYGINVDMLREICIVEEKWHSVYDYLYGKGGSEELSDADIENYYKNTYSRVKIIAVYTEEKVLTDSDGMYVTNSDGSIKTVALTEEERNEKRRKIADIEEKLRSGDEFETVMTSYSEVDSSYYTNGFFINSDSSKNFGTDFVDAVKEMSDGDIRRIDDNGVVYFAEKYSLIEMDDFLDCDKEQLTELEENAKTEAYYKKFASLAGEVWVDESILDSYSIRSAAMNTYF